MNQTKSFRRIQPQSEPQSGRMVSRSMLPLPQTLLATLGILMFFSGEVRAAIAVLNAPITMAKETGTGISVSVTVSSGANALVVVFADHGGGSTFAGPASLSWGTQTLNLLVSQNNMGGTYRDSAIYYLFNPKPGTANITGTCTASVTDTLLTAYTLGNVATTAPLTGSAGNSSTKSLTISITTVPAGAYAAVGSIYGDNTASVTAFTITASSGTVNAPSDKTDLTSYTDMGYVSGMSAGTGTFTTTATTTGSANKLACVAAVFTPSTAGALSAANTTISAVPNAINANGTSTSTITVQAEDASGNYLTATAGTVTLATSLGAISAVTDNGNGTYTATLTSSTTAGTANLTGTIAGSTIGVPTSVTFTGNPLSQANSVISASPASITANGTSTSTITVQAKDTANNNFPGSGGTVILSTTLGTLGAVTDNGNGTYTATLTSALNNLATATVSGTIAGGTIGHNATVSFVPGPVSAANTVISANHGWTLDDGTSTTTITVQAKDATGNNLAGSGGTVVLSATLGTLGGVTDNGNGTYTATLTAATTPGISSITGTIAGTAIGNTASLTFTGPSSPANAVINASPGYLLANGVTTSTITVQARDSNNYNFGGGSAGTVVLSTTLGSLGSVTDNGNGTYTAIFTSATTPGTAAITGTLGGVAIGNPAAVVCNTLYLQDGFNYTNGTQLGNNAPWTSPKSGITITNATMPAYVLGGALLKGFSPDGLHVANATQPSGYGTTYAPLQANLTTGNGGFVYCSFVVDFTGVGTNTGGSQMLGLLATNQAAPQASGPGLLDLPTEAFTINGNRSTDNTLPAISLLVANSTEGTRINLALNTTYFIVIKYDLTTGNGYLFLNPIPGTPEPATATITSGTPSTTPSFTGATALGRFYLKNNLNNPRSGDDFYLDTLRIGTNWSDVTPAAVNENVTWKGDGGGNAWDYSTANWLTNSATPATVFHTNDSVTFDDTATNFTVNLVSDMFPVSVTVNATNNYTLTNNLTGLLDGNTILTKANSGILTIASSNNFSGVISVSGGVLRMANQTAFGTNGTVPVTITNGGCLDLNGQYLNYLYSRPLYLSGSGNGLGAITNGSTWPTGWQSPSMSFNSTLMGDTALGSGNGGRYDLGYDYGGTLAGNGHKLTKIGAGEIDLRCVGSTSLGDIEIQQGTLYFRGGGNGGAYTVDMGYATNTLTVDANATLGLWIPNTNLNKVLAMNSPATFASTSGSNTFIGPITLNGTGTNTFSVNSTNSPSALTLIGAITGNGSLNKTLGAKLTLNGTNTYSGNTIISAGTLALGANGSISNTPLVSIAAGSIFDVSASASGFSFSGASPQQTLAGASASGVATNIAGTGVQAVTLASGALAAFQAAGGGSSTVGKISVLGDLNVNGNAINVTVTGSALAAGTYRLLDCTGTLTGTANPTPSISGTVLSSGYTAAVSTTTGSAGHVDLVVNATPIFTGLTASPGITYGATSVVLSGTVSCTTGPTTVYAASGDTVSAAINGHSVNGTVSGSSGAFTITYNDASLKTDGAGSSPYNIAYAYTGNSGVFLNAAVNNTSTSLTVSQAPLTVTADNKSRAYGAANPALTYTITGFQNSENAMTAGVTGAPALSTTANASSPVAGSPYTITCAANNLSAANYAFNYANGTLTISQASTFVGASSTKNPSGYKDSISFQATLPSDATGSVVFSLTNGPISTNSVSAGVATSASITNLVRGTNVITVSYGGDSNYLGSTTNLNQIVTNHPPVAAVMTVTRTAGLRLLIALSDMANNWSDADGDSVELTGVNMQSTNGVNLLALNWTTNLDGSFLTTTSAYAYIGYTNSPNVADQISYGISDGQGGTNVGYIEIVIQGSVTGTNSITACNFISPYSNTVTAYGVPGYYYILERATNLSSPTWVDIQTIQAATNGVINMADQFLDLGGSKPSPAFYQLKWQP